MPNQNEIDLRIKALLDDAAAAKSLKELKASMRELQSAALEYAETNQEAFIAVSQAAGQLRGRIDDARGSIQSLSGDPIENLSASINLASGSLRGLDFGQASQGLKNFATSIKGVNFKDIKAGLAGVADGFSAIGKALLANPIFLVAAAAVAIGAAFYALKDNGGAVAKVFGLIADTVKVVTDAFKALSDAIGLTDFASKKRNENELKRLEVEKAAIEERYALEVALAESTGKSVAEANAKKLRDAQKNAADLLQNTKDRIALTGRNEKTYTADEKKEIAERVAAYKAASNELNVFYLGLQKQARDNSIQLSRDIAQNQAELATNAIDRAKKTAKAQIDEIDRANREKSAKETADLQTQQNNLKKIYYDAQKELNEAKKTDDGLRIINARKAYNEAFETLKAFTRKSQAYINDIAKKDAEDKAIVRKKEALDLLTAQQNSLSILRDNQKKQLDVTTSDLKISYEDKLRATKAYLEQERKNIADSYNLQIAIAGKNDSGNLKKIKEQKALELQLNRNSQDAINKQLLEADRKFKAELIIADLDYQQRKLEANKQFHLQLDQQLKDDLQLIQVGADKEVAVRTKAFEDAKVEAVGNADKLKQIETEYQRDIALIKDTADKASLKRQKDYNLEAQMRIRQYQAETIQLEMEHIQNTSVLQTQAKIALINSQYEITRQGLEAERALQLQQLQAGSEEYLAMKAKYDALEQQNEDAKRKAIRDAKLQDVQQGIEFAQMAANAASAINDVFNQGENDKLKTLKKGSVESEAIRKKQFERQKIFTIAQAVINTASAVTMALGSLPPPASYVAAGLAGVTGLAQIVKIKSAKFEGQSADSGGSSGAEIKAPSTAEAPTLGSGGAPAILKSQSELTLGANKLNSIGGGSSGQSPYGAGYQRVYVLESDITTTQQKVAVTTQRSTLSGV